MRKKPAEVIHDVDVIIFMVSGTKFDAIDKEWGSMELYFKNGLMLSESEIEKIKSLYLE